MRLLPLLLLALACASPPSSRARLEGRVTDASGQPVEGAVVALIPAHSDWEAFQDAPTGRVRSAADGHFHFEELEADAYLLSATAPGHTTHFTSSLPLGEGEALRDVTLRLEPPSARVEGRVLAEDGTSTAGAWVAVVRSGTRPSQVAYVQADDQGAYAVGLAAGDYALSTEREGLFSGTHPVTVRSPGPVHPRDVRLPRPSVKTLAAPEVEAWIRDAAVPLVSVEAGHGFEDLAPLEAPLSRARVVSLGEATHGSREFFQLKHRMFEFLVTRLGFTVFAIEANFGEALVVNDYVLTGQGDPAAALAGLYFWTWDTEEVLALIHWMRAYNADPAHPRKLKFQGVDMQVSPASARALLTYLAQVDPSYQQQVSPRLTPMLDLRYAQTAKAPLAFLQGVEARLQAERAAYVRQSSEEAWALAARHARVLAQMAEKMAWPERVGLRDQAMAENALWILEHEGPDAKMMLWAHNGHVTANPLSPLPLLGGHLREALGDAHYVFGFAFHQGGFRAVDFPTNPQRVSLGVIPFQVPPTPEYTVDATLARAGPPLFALDLRAAPATGPVADFLTTPRGSRWYGSIYREGLSLYPLRPRLDFDGLLFVETVHPSVPTATGARPQAGASPR